MIVEMALYAGLTCPQVNELISNAKKFEQRTNFSNAEVQEVIDVLKDSTPECFDQ
tara:strand:+ start:228 stop:392 length:165 start_codon:yes stop_codon:yes gene_type:complete